MSRVTGYGVAWKLGKFFSERFCRYMKGDLTEQLIYRGRGEEELFVAQALFNLRM